jgi:serine/threonine protein kinase
MNPPQASVKTPTAPSVSYRCVCGNVFDLNPNLGGHCQHCHREVPAAAFRDSMTATVSLNSLEEPAYWDFSTEHTDHDPHIGLRLDHFLLERRLGEGGMGVVYRALDTSLQRYVAVKVLRRNVAERGGRHSIDQLLQEAVAQARLNHPNIVTIYYVGQHNDEPFLAMELVSGRTLAQQAKEEPLPFHHLIHLAVQVVDALRHASQFGSVHGDIKPSNLLVANSTRIKLSDFGLSRLIAEDQEHKSISGTPNYLAPELLSGASNSPQSDMYSLGVTLFELTFQRLPIELKGDSLAEKLEKHQTSNVDFPTTWPPSVPLGWKTILTKLLSKNPEQRYENYESLLEELYTLIPIGSTVAGFAPRAAAFLIDQLLLLCFALPLFAWTAIAQLSSLSNYWSWTSWISAFGMILLPFIYIAFVGSGRRSLGRMLFQIRVVNSYGLPLDKQRLMLREFVRCLPVITLTWGMVAGSDSIFHQATQTFVFLFVLANIATMLFYRTGHALHDYLFNSSAVLDFSPSRASISRSLAPPTY